MISLQLATCDLQPAISVLAQIFIKQIVVRVHRTRLGERSEDAEGEQHRVERIAFGAMTL
jgi:hypothetical protein